MTTQTINNIRAKATDDAFVLIDRMAQRPALAKALANAGVRLVISPLRSAWVLAPACRRLPRRERPSTAASRLA